MNENTDAIDEETQAGNSIISERSPLRAVLLTLLMTGLGHVYCGELVIGLVWAAVGALSGVYSLWGLATQELDMTVASLPMWFVSIAAVAHVWWTANKCPSDYRLKQYNNWFVYVLLIAISSVGVVGHGLVVRTNIVEAYYIPTSNMDPTLKKGDRFLVDKTAYRDRQIQSGDVVVFNNPANPKQIYVERVVALAGDKIEIRDDSVIINGRRTVAAEDHRPPPKGDPSDVFEGSEVVVPPYNCFVLGDNFENSRDSRHFGPIPYASVLGKATVIFWPQESWSRLGQID